jgi:hypothetical protein
MNARRNSRLGPAASFATSVSGRRQKEQRIVAPRLLFELLEFSPVSMSTGGREFRFERGFVHSVVRIHPVGERHLDQGLMLAGQVA